MSNTELKLPAFTDLGSQLIADKDGTLRHTLLGKINHTLSAKRKAMELGIPATDKPAADSELKALQGAARIIELLWHAAHAKPNTQPPSTQG